MNSHLKSSLEASIERWLDKNADEIGGTEGIYQDDTSECSTARIIASAAETAIDAMRHQAELIRKFET